MTRIAGFSAGQQHSGVAIVLTCPANHLMLRWGRSFDTSDHWYNRDGAPQGEKSRVEWYPPVPPDAVQGVQLDTVSVRLRCLTEGSDDQYDLDKIRAVVNRLYEYGTPQELRLTKARFDDIYTRMSAVL